MAKHRFQHNAELQDIMRQLEELEVEEEDGGTNPPVGTPAKTTATRSRSAQAGRKSRKAQKNLVPVIVSCSVGFVVVVLAVLWWVNHVRKATPAQQVVPNVVGQPIGAAKDAVTDAGLRAVVEYDEASTKSVGTVISSIPSAGAKVLPGIDVNLKVAGKQPASQPVVQRPQNRIPGNSSSPIKNIRPAPTQTPAPMPHPVTPEVTSAQPPPSPSTDVETTIPDVEGMVVVKAKAMLAAKGFKVIETPGRDPGLPDRVVLSCYPKPNTQAKFGALVQITVNTIQDTAMQPVQIPLPNYTGMSGQTALKDVQNRGFTTKIVYESSRLQPSGYVLKTDPIAGTQVTPGSQVTLVVAQ